MKLQSRSTDINREYNSLNKNICVSQRHTLYDTTYFDGKQITFFTKPIGAESYSPVRAGYTKTRSDTNMEASGGGLNPLINFIVESIYLEENLGGRWTPLTIRGYAEFMVGSRIVVSLPTDISFEEIPSVFIPPQRNFCVSLNGEILDRSEPVEPVYRCRLNGVMWRQLQ